MDADYEKLLSDEEIPASLRLIIARQVHEASERQKAFGLERKRLGQEMRKLRWTVTSAAVLAGLVMLIATLVLGRIATKVDAENTVELEFQHEIIRMELTRQHSTEAELAQALLFFARAGVLTTLDEEELRAMVKEQPTGSDKSEVSNIPSETSTILPTGGKIHSDSLAPLGVSTLDPKFTFPPGYGEKGFGINVSQSQGDIDWTKVSQSGVAFAFIKALDGDNALDRNFQVNSRGARQNNIPFAAYHTLSPLAEANDQAVAFLEIEGVMKGSLPFVVEVGHYIKNDGDKNDQWGKKSAPQTVRMIDDFIQAIEQKTQRSVIIYVDKFWWDKSVGSSGGPLTGEHEFWLKSDRPLDIEAGIPNPIEHKQGIYWRFTRSGRVPGITGSVDISVKLE